MTRSLAYRRGGGALIGYAMLVPGLLVGCSTGSDGVGPGSEANGNGDPPAEQGIFPESAHPYPNSYYNEWTYTLSGDHDAIEVTFDPQTETESCCDRVFVTDVNGNNVVGSPFTGTSLSGVTAIVPGSTVRIVLDTDSTITRWGFRVTEVSPAGECTGVRFELLDAQTLPPSVVRLYYQLETCRGEPLPGLDADVFLITEDDQEVSLFESDQDFAPDSRCFGLSTILLLDLSGSIVDSESLPTLQQAATAFIETIADEQTIAIYTFDGRATMQRLTDFTDDVEELISDVDSLSQYVVVDESTNLNGAVVEGLTILDQELVTLDPGVLSAGAMVVFTDGTDQAARLDDDSAVSAASESPHSVFTIGLGVEVDEDHLQAVGKDGTYIAEEVTELQSVFAEAAAAIIATADSYYVLAYCSPKRAGTHELDLSVRGEAGSVAFDFEADGFTGGCSADDFVSDSGCEDDTP